MKEKLNKKIKDIQMKDKNLSKIIILFILILIVLDQISKIIIINVKEIIIIPNVFKLSLEMIESDKSIITVIIEYIIVFGIIIRLMVSQNQFIEKKLKFFLSFVLAGGFSNLVDIMIRGHIINFINIKIVNVSLPVLNIAYIYIIIGGILFAGNFAIFTSKEMENKKSGKIHS